MNAFERYVNSKDNQTMRDAAACWFPFERYVNSKDNQTYKLFDCLILSFERYVNSKDNQTPATSNPLASCLRDM